MARTAIPLIVLDPVTAQFVANAQVTVLNRSDSSSATVYQAETGSTSLTQPLLTDSTGRITGWLNRGSYIFNIQVPGRSLRQEYYDSAPASNQTIDSNWYGAGSITSSAIGTGQVVSSSIASAAVTSSTIATGAVGSTNIATGAVGTSQLAPLAVATNNLQDASVTLQKLAAGLISGDKTLLGANINSFTVDNTYNGFYIYPYYWPFPGKYYYRGSVYLFSDTPNVAGPHAVDQILTNDSPNVRVSVWMGGATALSNADIGLTVTIDGIPQTPMISNVINQGPYFWFGWTYYYGIFQNVNATQLFTGITPGTHSWNIQTTWGSAYAYNASFVSSGTTMVIIQEAR